MSDICNNLPTHSPDRAVNFLRMQCDAYDELAREAQNLRWSAKLQKMTEMAELLNQIRDMQNQRKMESGIETQNTPPFSILQGNMKVKILTFYNWKPETRDGVSVLSQMNIQQTWPNNYKAVLTFDTRVVTVDFEYSWNILTVSYMGERQVFNIDKTQKLIQQRNASGAIETFTTTGKVSINIRELRLELGNFK